MKKWLKAVVLIYLVMLFFGSFIAVGNLWTEALEETLLFIPKLKIFLYYFFAGAIGGSLRHLYMFCSHYMQDGLSDYKVWVMYIFYPIFATGTAVIAVTLIQSGVLMIEFVEYIEGTPYAQISFAFFVGFGFNRFLRKLNEISQNMFETKKESGGGVKG